MKNKDLTMGVISNLSVVILDPRLNSVMFYLCLCVCTWDLCACACVPPVHRKENRQVGGVWRHPSSDQRGDRGRGEGGALPRSVHVSS